MSAGEFEGHEALIARLHAGTLDAPGHLHRRVLANAPGRRRRLAAMSVRRRFFVALPVAASLAVGAAVVHGVFFSKSGATVNGAALRLSPRFVPDHGTPGGNGATGPQGPTGAIGAAGAQGATGMSGTSANGSALAAPAPIAPLHRRATYGPALTHKELQLLTSDQAAQARTLEKGFSSGGVTIPSNRLVHAEATLQVSVANHAALTRATNKATAIISGLGGYSQSVQYAAAHNGYGRAYLDLRVPLGKTEDAIRKLSQLGQVLGQTIATQDLEQQYRKQSTQIDQLRRAIAIYEQALQSGTLSSSQRIDTQIKLANAQHELAGTRKSRSKTVKSGRTADISLTLSTGSHAAAVPHKTGRLGQMLHNMGDFLGIEGIVVLYALIVMLPIALVFALVWWILHERRRREENLLASA